MQSPFQIYETKLLTPTTPGNQTQSAIQQIRLPGGSNNETNFLTAAPAGDDTISGMKNFLIIVLALGLLGGAFLSRPDREEFERYLQRRFAEPCLGVYKYSCI